MKVTIIVLVSYSYSFCENILESLCDTIRWYLRAPKSWHTAS